MTFGIKDDFEALPYSYGKTTVFNNYIRFEISLGFFRKSTSYDY